MKKAKTSRCRAKTSDTSEVFDSDIHFAALEGNLERLQQLLENGTFVDLRGGSRWTALHYAANAGELEAAKLLLEHGASGKCVSDSGDTALHLLVVHNFSNLSLFHSVLSLMLVRGASLDAVNNAGQTPIDSASARGRMETRHLLSRLVKAPSPYEYSTNEEDDSETDLKPPDIPAPVPSVVRERSRPRSSSSVDTSKPHKHSNRHSKRRKSSTKTSPRRRVKHKKDLVPQSLDSVVQDGPLLSDIARLRRGSPLVSTGSLPSRTAHRYMHTSESSESENMSCGYESSTSSLHDTSSALSCTDAEDPRTRQRRAQRNAEDEQMTGRVRGAVDAAALLLSPRQWQSTRVLPRHKKVDLYAPVKLLDKMLTETIDSQSVQDYLVTFRLYMNSRELVDLLIERFELPDPDSVAMVHATFEGGILTQETLLRTRTKIIEFLILWISQYFPDFSWAPEVHDKLIDFINKADAAITTKGSEAGVVSFLDYFPMSEHLDLKAVVSNAIDQSHKVVQLLETTRGDGAGVPSLAPAVPIDVTSIDPEELACQMTLVAEELFSNATPLLFVHYHHCEADDDPYINTVCSSVRRVYSHFALLRQWVITVVVTQAELSVRCEVLERFIKAALRCEAMSNFFSSNAIVQALHSPIIGRLTQTWLALSKKTSSAFTEFLSTYGTRNNVVEYSRLVDEKKSLIPNIDVLKREFGAHPNNQEIDWARLRRLMRVLSSLSVLPYEFEPNDDVQHALINLEVLPDEIAAEFSNSIESPTTQQAVVIPIECENLCCSIRHGVFTVTSGTVDGLIDHLLNSDFIAVSQEFVDTFFMTQCHFISAHELLAKILTKGDVLHSGAAASLKGKELEEFLHQQSRRRTRVMTILRRWMELSYQELKLDQKFVNTLLMFCKQAEMASSDESFFFIHTLSTAFGKHPRLRKKMKSVLHDTVQGFTLTESVYSMDKMFEDQFSKEAAKQLCLIDQKLFQMITARELLRRSGDSRIPLILDAKQADPSNHLAQWSARFNMLSQWVATCVVSQREPQLRSAMLKQLIKLAWECMILNNFNSSYAIVAGLNSSAIARLKSTWEGVSSSVRAKFKKLEHMFDFRANHKNYRAALRSVEPPIVPFLGIYTKDIFALQENNPDRLDNGHINFEKFAMLVRIIHDVLQYQSESYNIESNAPLQHFLWDIKVMDEESMYEASLRREATNTPVVVHNPLFGTSQADVRRVTGADDDRAMSAPPAMGSPRLNIERNRTSRMKRTMSISFGRSRKTKPEQPETVVLNPLFNKKRLPQ